MDTENIGYLAFALLFINLIFIAFLFSDDLLTSVLFAVLLTVIDGVVIVAVLVKTNDRGDLENDM